MPRRQELVVYFIWLLATSLTPALSQAKNAIHDPAQLLPAIRSFGGQPEFRKAFACGDSAIYRSLTISCEKHDCSKDMCMSVCKAYSIPAGMRVQRQIVNCTEETVGVYLDTGDLAEISKTDYVAAHLSAVELFLSDVAAFINYPNAEVTVTKTAPGTYTVARGTSQEKPLSAMHVFGTIGLPGRKQLEFILTQVQGLPQVGAVARFRLGERSWFLLDSAKTEKRNSK